MHKQDRQQDSQPDHQQARSEGKPSRSEQRRHPKPSRLLMALMHRMQGWLSALLSRLGGWLKTRRARLAEAARSMSFELLEPRVLMSADLFPAASVGMAGAMHFSGYEDPSGNTSERSMLQDEGVSINTGGSGPVSGPVSGFNSGPISGALSSSLGTAHILATPTAATTTVTDGDGTVVTATVAGGGLVDLSAQGGGYLLTVTGTTAASVLTLTTAGGDGRVAITGIDVTAALGEARMATADLSGQANFAGGVKTLTVGDISNATLRNTVVGAASFTARDAQDLRLNAPLADLAVTVRQWGATVAEALPAASVLVAAGVSSLTVA